jgi:CelD/BcsL family acetyltransferase involved in cellulose biosynthesis
LQIDLIDNFDDFLKVGQQWNSLLEKSRSNSPFLTHQWLNCWWKSYGSGRKLFVLSAKEDEEIVALAPLMIEKVTFRGLPIKKLCFMADGNSLLVDFILVQKKEECLKGILDFIEKRQDLWDIISLENLSIDRDSFKILSGLLEKRQLLYGINPGLDSPYIDINTGWDNFFSQRPKKFREVTRNKQNRLKKIGQLEFEKHEKISPELLQTLFDIGSKCWKNKKKRAISSTKEKKSFFECLSYAASREGWLLIWLLKLNQKPIAYEYHLKYKDEVWGLRSEYDEDYKEAGPGTVLDRYIMEQIFNGAYKKYNLGWGADFYKLRWTEKIKEHKRILIFNPSPYGRLLFFLEFILIKRLKQLLGLKRNYA